MRSAICSSSRSAASTETSETRAWLASSCSRAVRSASRRLALGEPSAVGLDGGLELGEPGRELGLLGPGGGATLLGGAPGGGQLEVAGGGEVQLELPDLRPERLVLLGLARLAVEAVQLLAQLG